MKERQRTLAMLLAALLAVIVLFSVFYIAMEAGHDCDGENCAICAVLSVCESILHRLLGIGAAAALVLSAAVFVCRRAAAGKTVSAHATLITLKVKLSN